ncbi:MAG: phosphate-starvation-inducible PsiE family protein [Caldivirga sp.]|nr:phosphate-starvation-inducible PsiE family protein [Caldivirga sp.]
MGKENMRTSMARALRLINISLYVFVILLTVVVSLLSLYIAITSILGSIRGIASLTDLNIISILSSLFLVVLTMELIEMFIAYMERGMIIVDMVIAIVLTAVARELLINFANIESLTLQRGIIITAAILVLSISYWLVNKAEQIKKI